MATLTATAAVDMTDWHFENILAGTIEQAGSTKYAIAGATGGLHYQFIGSDLHYDTEGPTLLLTAGTITGYRVLDSTGSTILSVNGFILDAYFLENLIQAGDEGEFGSTVFASNNTITGSAFDDILQGFSTAAETISGGDGNDNIIDFTIGDSELGRADTILGGAGDDTVFVGGEWVGNTVDGGTGFDTVVFSGDYPLLLTIGAGNFKSVEAFALLGGPHYTFTMSDDLVAAGANLRIDASSIGNASANIFIDGHLETDGTFEMLGSAGNDVLRGGHGADTFWLDKGGRDKVYGGDGDDVFNFGSTFSSFDRVRGGAGTDTLKLGGGDYDLSIDHSMLSGIETISLAGGHSYKLFLADFLGDLLDAGAELDIVGYQIGSGNDMTIFGQSVISGRLGFVDGGGNDTLFGGAGNDHFLMSKGGTNVVNGGDGDDTIEYLGNFFSNAEKITGGAGNDTLVILQDFTFQMQLTATTIVGIENIQLRDGCDYNIRFNDANFASGQTLTLDATNLTSDFGANIVGSDEVDGKFIFLGGAGDDVFVGGAGTDSFRGGGGADQLIGRGGVDTFVYGAAADSTGRHFDRISDFNGALDLIDVPVAVTGRDLDIGGKLNRATFNSDLALKVDAAHLAAGHVVFFKATTGNLAGDTFLVIDQDGVAGYAAGGDIVIDMTNIANQAAVTAATFI